MSDLSALYQEVVVEHSQRPRNFGPLEDATHTADGFNPLCGDEVSVHVRIEDGRLADVRFEGEGCAISKASASLMTGAVKGRDRPETDALFDAVIGMLLGERAEADVEIGKLEVLSGVCEFPVRVKCATLAWHTLKSALDGGETASTE